MKVLKYWLVLSLLATISFLTSCDKDVDPNFSELHDNYVNGHKYVDLGLPSGILWATMNIGATAPEEYGNYYAWGETRGYNEEDKSNITNYGYTRSLGSASYVKTCYNYSTYKYCNGTKGTINKYNYKNAVLEMCDDAAHVNWGGSWRMPTSEELEELVINCTITSMTLNGVDGCKFESITNGNYIFMPMAGARANEELLWSDTEGVYWSSSRALSLSFFQRTIGIYEHNRDQGLPIRAVCFDAK